MFASGRSHVLMVAYYFPSVGMGGVQRPLKFARYLPDFGWDVTVLTPELHSYPATDETLLAELPNSVKVIRVPARHPMQWPLIRAIHKGNGATVKQSGVLHRLSTFLRWPDDKRGFVHPALQAALALNRERRIGVVWTTSPPPSAHLVGLRLRDHLRIGWIADFRDPWFVRFDDLGPTRWHRRYAHSLRRTIAARADRLVAASRPIATSLDALLPTHPVHVIHNGYDEHDFVICAHRAPSDEPFTILLYGTMGENPDPTPLFCLLREWKERNPSRHFRLTHVGMSIGVDCSALAARHGISDHFRDLGYKPHGESIATLMSADVVALPMSARPEHRDNLPGRVFEVMRSLRPILLLAHESSEAARILRPIPGCWIVPLDERDAGIAALDEIAALVRSVPVRDSSSVAPFERREQTRRLAALLDAVKVTAPL